jgi:thiamine biosynthesis protein ThiS
MKVNGELVSVPEGSTLAAFLTDSRFNLDRIAVERNGAIVPKRDYETTRLKAEDSLEIVRFVGGG